jgi:DNA topoisomerase I
VDILIVESAAKARTLGGYLGGSWTVLATGGHVETLPSDRAQHGSDAGKAYWSNRKEELPSPPWVWTNHGEQAVEEIRAAAGPDTTFWIATDPDREGELIAWRLYELLAGRGSLRRVTFQEVTEEAVRRALEHSRDIDGRMRDSALLRMFLDRLVGYRASKLARGVLAGGTASMGRVQTPTLGFVVQRELEREAHVPIPYFEVRARAAGLELRVRFHEPGDADAWKDEGGNTVPTRTFDRVLASGAGEALQLAGRIELTEVLPGSRISNPPKPFTTDTLLQAAGSGFGWTPRKTSKLASILYEAGHITYIRTDSTRLAPSAVEAARLEIEEAFGADHLAADGGGGAGGGGAGPVQDAHEAVRPTRLGERDLPVPFAAHGVAGFDDADVRKLYRLVRARTLASQMAPSRYRKVGIRARAEGLERPLAGSASWRTFAGWEAAYTEFREEPATAPHSAPLEEGAVWTLEPESEGAPNPQLVQDETRPPARYRAHTLIGRMKKAGIGRPSTYSSTLDKLEDRNYVEIDGGSVAPTDRGRVAWLDVAPLYANEVGGTEFFSAELNANEAGGTESFSADLYTDEAGGTESFSADLNADDVGGTEFFSAELNADEAGGAEFFSADLTARMEETLDRVSEGGEGAAAVWERWRDGFVALHEIARERKKSGGVTPRTAEQLRALRVNAVTGIELPPDAETLTEGEARQWVARLREAGVEPAPSTRQREYLEELVQELESMGPEDAARNDLTDLSEVRTSVQASTRIQELQVMRDARRRPTDPQRKRIDTLRAKAGLSDTDAAGLVGVPSLEALTGGRQGSASRLIDLLKEAAAGAEGTLVP